MAKPKSDNTAERLVNSDVLAALVKEGTATQTQTSEISGRFGERVKNAVEGGNLNRKVFGWMRQLHKMEELDRIRAIRLFSVYCDKLIEKGVFGAMHVGDLVDDAEKAAEEDESGEEEFDAADQAKIHAEANAKALKGISELPEDKDRGALNGLPAKPANDIDDIPPVLDRRPSRKLGPALPSGDDAATGTYQ